MDVPSLLKKTPQITLSTCRQNVDHDCLHHWEVLHNGKGNAGFGAKLLVTYFSPLLYLGSEAWTVNVDFEKSLNGEYWLY